MRYDCDVLVVGGGPAGTRVAALTAQAGLQVILAEEHEQVGEPRHCTGIIGRRSFELLRLPREVVQNQLRSAIAISPTGQRARMSRRTVQAYVMDRARFDQRLFDEAVQQGAQPLLGARCVSAQVRRDAVEVELDVARTGTRQRLTSAMLVVATGAQYRLHRQLGLEPPQAFLASSQTEVQVDGIEETELYFGRAIAPGSFAWLVPISAHIARVGVTAEHDSPRCLDAFLRAPGLVGRVKDRLRPVRHRPIPVRGAPRTVIDRALIVGDAAGQVKPMTGGGIYYSILCAEVAAKAIVSAFTFGDLTRRGLATYDEQWRRAIEFELKAGWYLRQLLSRLEDGELEALVAWMKDAPVERLIRVHADFDWHARLIRSLARQPAFWSILLKCLQPQLKDWFFRNLRRAEQKHHEAIA